MVIYEQIYALPIWSIYLLTAIVLFLAAEAGFRFGRVIQKRWPDKAEVGVGTVVGASLASLGFLLAFVTNIAIDNYNQRRQLVVSEANAIGTTYLRAGYLPDTYGVDSRKLLVEYVNLRLQAINPAETEAAIARSEQIHDELWLLAEDLARENRDSTISLYISTLNEVIDLHTERINAELGFRVPQVIVWGLYLVAVITMTLLGVYDSYRENHNLLALLMVVLVVSLVFLLIVELDRSNVGLLQIPQKALIDLQQRLNMLP